MKCNTNIATVNQMRLLYVSYIDMAINTLYEYPDSLFYEGISSGFLMSAFMIAHHYDMLSMDKMALNFYLKNPHCKLDAPDAP